MRACCRSATAVPNDLILRELDGGPHYSTIPSFLFSFCSRFGRHFVTSLFHGAQNAYSQVKQRLY